MELIAAIATAQSPSAVGIVRLSGEGTRDALAALFTPANGKAVSDLPYRRMTYGDVRDETGALLDRCMAVCFSAAHSYTGEESAEIHCHGSPVVLGEVLRAAFRAGARQARPGEFTQRAFLNGKMDLTEAEAVIDLIDAETAECARNAAAQMRGYFGVLCVFLNGNKRIYRRYLPVIKANIYNRSRYFNYFTRVFH